MEEYIRNIVEKRYEGIYISISDQESIKNKSGIVVLGLSLYPKSTLELSPAKLFNKKDIYFALIHCEPDQRRERIIKRGTPQHWRGYQPWYDEFYEEMKTAGAFRIDTTNRSVKQTATEIKKWLVGLQK